MNQRTNHRAANNFGEVPATQEEENHPNAWGGELRTRGKTKGKGGRRSGPRSQQS